MKKLITKIEKNPEILTEFTNLSFKIGITLIVLSGILYLLK